LEKGFIVNSIEVFYDVDDIGYIDMDLVQVCNGLQHHGLMDIYWENGKKHREDGPAVIWEDGEKKWYLKGQLVYGYTNRLNEFDNLTEEFKKSIIKYELSK
jgi:hypothetical protein